MDDRRQRYEVVAAGRAFGEMPVSQSTGVGTEHPVHIGREHVILEMRIARFAHEASRLDHGSCTDARSTMRTDGVRRFASSG